MAEERDIDGLYYRLGGDPIYADPNQLAHEIHGKLILDEVKVAGNISLPSLEALRVTTNPEKRGSTHLLVLDDQGRIQALEGKEGQVPTIASDGSVSFSDEVPRLSKDIPLSTSIFVRKAWPQTIQSGQRVLITGWTEKDPDQDAGSGAESPSGDQYLGRTTPRSPGDSVYYVSEQAQFDRQQGIYEVLETGEYAVDATVSVSAAVSKISSGSVTLSLMVGRKSVHEMGAPLNANPKFPTTLNLRCSPLLKKGKQISLAVFLDRNKDNKSSVLVSEGPATSFSVRLIKKR